MLDLNFIAVSSSLDLCYCIKPIVYPVTGPLHLVLWWPELWLVFRTSFSRCAVTIKCFFLYVAFSDYH